MPRCWIKDYNNSLDGIGIRIAFDSEIKHCPSCKFEQDTIPEIAIDSACCCVHNKEFEKNYKKYDFSSYINEMVLLEIHTGDIPPCELFYIVDHKDLASYKQILCYLKYDVVIYKIERIHDLNPPHHSWPFVLINGKVHITNGIYIKEV